MGFLDFFKRWSKSEDERVLERAEEQTRMTPLERDISKEDYEARRDDLHTREWEPGASSLIEDEDGPS